MEWLCTKQINSVNRFYSNLSLKNWARSHVSVCWIHNTFNTTEAFLSFVCQQEMWAEHIQYTSLYLLLELHVFILHQSISVSPSASASANCIRQNTKCVTIIDWANKKSLPLSRVPGLCWHKTFKSQNKKFQRNLFLLNDVKNAHC